MIRRMAPDDPAVQAAADALDRLRAACQAAVEAAFAVADRQARFDAATRVGEQLGYWHATIADGRARTAREIRAAESLSLAGLADRLSISKARADQFVRVANRPGRAPTQPPQEETTSG
jgi:hypothetical protein